MEPFSFSREFASFANGDSLTYLFRMLVAYVLALPTAWNRERYERSAGLRTFPLVSLGACGYMLIGQSIFSLDDANSRVIYGIITGIGFIGGGAILKRGEGTHGTATAASIWNMGAVGVAVAWQRYDIALVLSALGYFTLRIVQPLKSYVRHEVAHGQEALDVEDSKKGDG